LAKRLSRSELVSLARVGAQARIAELEAEIASIRRTFGSGRGRKPGRSPGDTAAKPRRRRRKLSAAGRAKIAAAAKARWAKWRREKGK
jgi:hypothetical protein